MNRFTTSLSAMPVRPLYTTGTKPLAAVVAVALGTALLALSSWVQVPMIPVPMTLQALAVTLIGAFCGWRLGAATVIAWLCEAALGLPVLAGGHAGLAYMVGPTGGYLLSFVLAAALVGLAAERAWLKRSPARSFAVMLLANAAILAVGFAWLAGFVGPSAAMAAGVTPFLLGGAVKAGLAAGLVEAGSILSGRKRA